MHDVGYRTQQILEDYNISTFSKRIIFMAASIRFFFVIGCARNKAICFLAYSYQGSQKFNLVLGPMIFWFRAISRSEGCRDISPPHRDWVVEVTTKNMFLMAYFSPILISNEKKVNSITFFLSTEIIFTSVLHVCFSFE